MDNDFSLVKSDYIDPNGFESHDYIQDLNRKIALSLSN